MNTAAHVGASPTDRKLAVFLIIALFVAGAGFRAIDLWRGTDGSIRNAWREADISAVARNFYREGMNPLYPRIDWRGSGPGYAEMELPLLPWTMALAYHAVGVRPVVGRVISYLASLATLAVFMALAWRLLSLPGAVGATLFLVVSPLAVEVSNALQSESLMLFGYVLGVYGFVRWLDDESPVWLWTSAGGTALAILMKATAAHIGGLYLALLLYRRGFAAFRDRRVWLFAIVALLPGVLWYIHARRLWLEYGNSLGVSNESHFAGLDFFTKSRFIVGIVHEDLVHVWSLGGVAAAALALLLNRRARVVRIALFWLASILLYYMVIARTSSQGWAAYYHVVSVPPVALLMGASLDGAVGLVRDGRRLLLSGSAVLVVSLLLFGIGLVAGGSASHLFLRLGAAGATFGVVLSLVSLQGVEATSSTELLAGTPAHWLGLAVVAAAFSYAVLYSARDVYWESHPHAKVGLYHCAKKFAPFVPRGDLILASGGTCVDADGLPVAYNASYMFYWMDRKGFNICTQRQTLARVESFARRGAKYFVAEDAQTSQAAGFVAALRAHYPVVAECQDAELFRLAPSERSEE